MILSRSRNKPHCHSRYRIRAADSRDMVPDMRSFEKQRVEEAADIAPNPLGSNFTSQAWEDIKQSYRRCFANQRLSKLFYDIMILCIFINTCNASPMLPQAVSNQLSQSLLAGHQDSVILICRKSLIRGCLRLKCHARDEEVSVEARNFGKDFVLRVIRAFAGEPLDSAEMPGAHVTLLFLACFIK